MSRWYDKNKKQLCLVYLFLSSENRISDADLSLFERVGDSTKDFPKMKGEVIGDCEKILATPDGSKTRFEIVSGLLSEETTNTSPEDNRSVLWSLVGLLYQIEGRSESKEQLVETWAKKSNIDDSVLLEMHDTCKTQNAIVEYQKWLETSKDMSYQEINSIMQELDKNLKSMQQSVSDLIALG
jgi:hypothetical protein